jgi:hypothetical protein
MTTGRINQVTVLTPRLPPRRDPGDQGRVVCWKEEEPRRAGAWSRAAQDPQAIQLPPLDSLNGGPPHGGQALGAIAECRIGRSEGGYRWPITPTGADSSLGLPPNVLGLRMPIGQ